MNNWQTKKLSEVCEIKPNKRESKQKLSDKDFVSFLPMSDLGIMQKYVFANKENKLKNVYSGYTYFANNDVLLAKITPCFENGKLSIARNLKNGIGFGSSEYLVFRTKENIIPEYLFYILSNPIFREQGKKRMSGAVGHKRLAKEFIENYLILLPPLPTQKKIVKTLNEVFEQIEKVKKNTQKNLENSKELFGSYLEEIFKGNSEWLIKSLYEIAEMEKNKNGKKNLPYVGLEDIESNSGKFTGSLMPRNVKSSSFHFTNDHILYGRLRPYLNKVLIPDFEGHCSTEIFPIRVNNGLDKKFLFYWFMRETTVKRINFTCTGTRMPRANMNKIFKNFKINYPKNISQQKQIVAKLDELSEKTKRLEENYQRKLEDLEELKKSILQKAFSRELVN